MEKPEGSSHFKKWLEVLQQESWQLELIISGFAIFLVGGLKQPIFDLVSTAQMHSNGLDNDAITMIPALIILAAWFFLLINLILHVLLRGLWISTIGLRYVSGDIDFKLLNYSKKFDTFLRKRIVSFDNYIERLERICSVVFSFTFLIIFSLVSAGLYFTFIAAGYSLITMVFGSPSESNIADIIYPVFMVISLFTGLIYFIDFISLGFIKKIKWLSPIYYPIYRFYGFITLANVYRPIYYNLIDNKFGKWVGRLIVPYMLIAFYFIVFHVVSYKYYPELTSGDVFIKSRYYEDEFDEEPHTILSPFIQSKFISNKYIELFIPYLGSFDDHMIEKICPDFNPKKELGFKSIEIDINISSSEEDRNLENERDSSFICLTSLYSIKINDSTINNIKYRFFTLPYFEEPGVLSIIDVNYLERGENILQIDKLSVNNRINKDSTFMKNFATIPFWVE